MAMRKISFSNGGCYLGRTYIGVAKKYFEGKLLIKKGSQEWIATRGMINEAGEFVPLCKGEHCKSCKKKGKEDCRNNKKYRREEGYYIDEENLSLS